MPYSTDQVQAARILVVDDDPVQGAIISGVCRRRGYQPTFVSSYQSAVDQIAAGGFECITIDLSLGDRDGIELLRLIAAAGRSPRVIVISGCDQRILSATVRMAHAVGIVDAVSLRKPVDLTSLGDALSFGAGEQPSLRRRPDRRPRQVTADDLSRGLEAGEVYPAFQPKVHLATGKVVGCEALARWDSPTFGSVGPDVFIPLAEQGGLIKPLTMLMLRQSIEMARHFFDIDPSFAVAVNLSAALLSDTTMPAEVERLLDETRLPARSLIIEVTESTAMTDIACAMDIMLRLRIKGVGLSIDDFGTGYSSLAVLARMPFSELKIDRCFVKDCLTDADMWKVVSASVAIAHQYNMQAVAEGIEDAETWRALDGLGCDIGQGFGFSRGLRRNAFVEWCRRWDERLASVGAAERHRACAT
ncbi:EAL domain-containing protein [Rhodopseudomonas sp. NSM]|uniref:EAL domain-containing protein n=1 Tax=Rhodopseudomonas sp. NSM TaxID=3457630 RepID=UPI004035425D